MPAADRTLGMYLHLARASQLRRRPMVRDKLLVLAGVQAEEMGLEPISALCRHRILAHNARHLIRRWPTLTDALEDERFQSYLKQLKRRYSHEKIEHMLDSLGIELGRERDAYFSDLEYAAALLDTRPESIDEVLAQPPWQRDPHDIGPAHARPTARRWAWVGKALNLRVLPIWVVLALTAAIFVVVLARR
jgi:hypothetical protein